MHISSLSGYIIDRIGSKDIRISLHSVFSLETGHGPSRQCPACFLFPLLATQQSWDITCTPNAVIRPSTWHMYSTAHTPNRHNIPRRRPSRIHLGLKSVSTSIFAAPFTSSSLSICFFLMSCTRHFLK